MIWAGNEKNVQTFIENHLMNGTFTDNYGILNYVTSFLLNVNFNIVGISNYVANQLTKISCGNDNASTLWVCNYQDSSLRAGHYISLAGKEAERTYDNENGPIFVAFKSRVSLLEKSMFWF